MRSWLGWALLMVSPGAQAQRQVLPFDAGWQFLQADAAGAEASGFADARWKTVDVPHDWAIAGPFEQANTTGGAGAFAPAGVGRYRKHFALPAGAVGKRVYVQFDGVMANSDVWINGTLLGHRPNGYVSFGYELTGKLQAGENVLAVRADNEKQPASRWYEGAGIYRHVRLVVENPVHLVQASTFVSAKDVSAASASVRVESAVLNQSAAAANVGFKATLMDPSGKVVGTASLPAQALAAGEEKTLNVTIAVTRPDRWDLDHPVLYRARVEAIVAGKPSDADEVKFGIREFHFDANTGFWLNGRNVKIKGVALHGDVGSLGVAAPLGAWEHRLTALKKLGVNGIRTAHNPPAPELLDLCDRMGFVVMDEMFDQWTVAKNPYDYHLYFMQWYLKDVRDTVRRDRNHPSIVLWSAGNEIHDTPKAELAKSILGPMVEEFHKNDPTRPVTQALFRPNVSHDYEDGLADLLDVIGQNYRPNEILAAHAQKRTRKIIGTENTHGIDQWLPVRDHPEYSGMFIWAGVDYLGESRRWPVIGSSSGLLNRLDVPVPDGLEHESWWSTSPVMHIVRRVAPTPLAPTDPGYEAEQFRPRQTVYADWSPKIAAAHPETVEVYSNCASVELTLNGRSMGAKARNADDRARSWTVGFEAGTLTAVGKNGSAACAEETLRTAGKPAKIKLVVERARLSPSFDDVGYVRATVTDEQGTAVPDDSSPLTFSVSGPGTIVATDNGDNADHSGFQRLDRAAYHGSAIAIVRGKPGPGVVTVAVSAQGLSGSSVTLKMLP